MTTQDPVFWVALTLWLFTALSWVILKVRDDIIKHKVINVRPKHLRPQGVARSRLTTRPQEDPLDLLS